MLHSSLALIALGALAGSAAAQEAEPAAPTAPSPEAEPAGPDRRPNILLVFADDQRVDTIGAWGNPAIQTPNMDRIAEKCNVPRACAATLTSRFGGRPVVQPTAT